MTIPTCASTCRSRSAAHRSTIERYTRNYQGATYGWELTPPQIGSKRLGHDTPDRGPLPLRPLDRGGPGVVPGRSSPGSTRRRRCSRMPARPTTIPSFKPVGHPRAGTVSTAPTIGGNTDVAGSDHRRTARGRPIPGPRGLPLLGSIRDIQRDNIQTFMDAWREYGDIVHFRGPLTINLLVHPDYVQHVLKDNNRNYPRPMFVQDKLKSIVGDGLVATEGEVWLRSRKLTQPAFHNEIVAGLGGDLRRDDRRDARDVGGLRRARRSRRRQVRDDADQPDEPRPARSSRPISDEELSQIEPAVAVRARAHAQAADLADRPAAVPASVRKRFDAGPDDARHDHLPADR